MRRESRAVSGPDASSESTETPSHEPSLSVLERIQPGRTIVPVRVFFGLLLCVQSAMAIREYGRSGYFAEHFHIPDIPEALIAPRSLYVGLLAARLIAALLLVFGRTVRLAAAVSGLLLIHSFLSDRLQFHHNRYSLALFALLLALCAPRGRGREPVSTFPIWLARVQVSLIYLASSGSKLLDPDWRCGVVLADRITRHTAEAIGRGVPSAVLSLLSSPRGSSLLALITIGTELAIAVLLWNRRWRKRAIYLGLGFHLMIEITSRVELFSWVMLAAYGFFVTPDVEARTIHYENRGVARALASLLRVVDWFGRFQLVPFEPDAITPKGQALVLTDRDERRYVGKQLLARTASSIPVLFPLWPMFALWARVARSRDAARPTANASCKRDNEPGK